MFKVWELLENKKVAFELEMEIQSNSVDEFLDNLDDSDFPF